MSFGVHQQNARRLKRLVELRSCSSSSTSHSPSWLVSAFRWLAAHFDTHFGELVSAIQEPSRAMKFWCIFPDLHCRSSVPLHNVAEEMRVEGWFIWIWPVCWVLMQSLGGDRGVFNFFNGSFLLGLATGFQIHRADWWTWNDQLLQIECQSAGHQPGRQGLKGTKLLEVGNVVL